MTLEDFFTSTEMRDGLIAPSRVQEFVTAMRKKKNKAKNDGDATRQWVAVASTIAATENKECLDLFKQLGGLFLINSWLTDAQKFGNEESGCLAEEALSALLQAVEHLRLDIPTSVSSGIYLAVKRLLRYKSPKIQSMASTLCESWEFSKADWELKKANSESMGFEDAEKVSEHAESECIGNDTVSTGFDDAEKVSKHAEYECIGNDTESTGFEAAEKVSDLDNSRKTSGHNDIMDECPDLVASPDKLDSIVNDVPVNEDMQCSLDRNLDSQILAVDDEVSEKREETEDDDKVGNLPNNVDKAEETVDTDPDASTYERSERVLVKTSSIDNTISSVVKSSNESILERVGNDEGGRLDPKGLDQGTGSVLVETKDEEPPESRSKEVGVDDEAKIQQQKKNKKKRFGKKNKFAKLTKNSKKTDFISQTANNDVEDAMFDPLEVACLVANEVAREVVNYEEQSNTSSSTSTSSSSSSSSSERISTSKSIIGEQDQEINSQLIKCSTIENASLEASNNPLLNSPAKEETNPENHVHDMESSQLTAEVRHPRNKTTENNCFLEFDLNQELASEEGLDHNAVSIVSASRAVVGPGIQSGPLKFEGSLGWKGSAATSAFRPASPRRASDSDRAFSSGPASSGSRQRQDFLDIDLNVASGDEKVVNHTENSAPPNESSFELGSRQSERLKFDLNQMEDDNTRAPSPASSSSCIHPLPTRNFDLNDNLSYVNDPSNNTHFFPWGPSSSSNTKVNPYVGGHQEDSVISIFGTKVKKNTSTFPPQTTSFPFQNGRVPVPVPIPGSDPFIDANLLRGGTLPLMGLAPAIPYPQSMYGYNGLPMGPGPSFSSAPIYGPPGGPIPYMFDTRGTPYGPPSIPSSYCQPSLVMNMMGPTQAPNVNLSSSYPVDVGNRDTGFFRQLFIPGQGQQLNDQLRDSFRPPSSGTSGGKRKEPETGWELFPTNYKHNQPPHL